MELYEIPVGHVTNIKIIRFLRFYAFVWSVYDTEWRNKNRPCSNKTLNTPRKRQEATKGRGNHVYLVRSFAGREDMVLTDYCVWLEGQYVRLHHKGRLCIV